MNDLWEPMNISGILAIVYWIIFTPFFFITLFLTIKRRDRYPLKQREPWLLSTSAVGGYIMLTSFSWEAFVGTEKNC